MKKVVSIVALIVFIAALLYFFRYFKGKGTKDVGFDNVEADSVPAQINEVLPNYRVKEKALVCKINDEVYVVVTRGEKNTAGYDVGVKELKLSTQDGAKVLTVYAEFTDPVPGEVSAQILTYPYTVIKTELSELPDKVVLEREYKH